MLCGEFIQLKISKNLSVLRMSNFCFILKKMNRLYILVQFMSERKVRNSYSNKKALVLYQKFGE